MSLKCKNHPGRPAVFEYNGVHYCQKCEDGYESAVKTVETGNRHVEPKDCFVVYAGGDRWEALSGTGCAHWVSHQKKLQAPSASNTCLKGCRVRVADLATYCRSHGSEIKELEKVRVGDIWIAGDKGHMGIVSSVKSPADPKHPDYQRMIVIKHDSSGQGKVAENELQWLIGAGGHGPSQGHFHRLRA